MKNVVFISCSFSIIKEREKPPIKAANVSDVCTAIYWEDSFLGIT